MRPGSRRFVVATAVAALLVFGAAWVETAFVHDDDGCQVETHCLACRWAAGTTAVLDAGLVLPVSLAVTQEISTEAPAFPGGGILRLATSRGPPSA
jgi:hypothetical protein